MATVEEAKTKAKERMEKALDALHSNFASVRTGRANPMVLDRILVDYYGTKTPINQMAAVKTPDAHLLVIEPYDKSSIKNIETAILESDLGIVPNSDGQVLRLPFPTQTEERRKELAKQCKGLAEEAKVAVRNARRDANNELDKMKKDEGLPEDDVKREQNNVQKLTDDFIAQIDKSLSAKEAELMEI
ncbi:MAG: ribosome recycling factor [Phoenicibacter congonensis]|uniref:Ribosome-recycling factor n=1 Tax=Phoenicibacter congonensis TaxID=1944646 RepID=A0AA43U9A4_9ACTN|nr:ribosome recycling factor [Phoenicibacter congonensis]